MEAHRRRLSALNYPPHHEYMTLHCMHTPRTRCLQLPFLWHSVQSVHLSSAAVKTINDRLILSAHHLSSLWVNLHLHASSFFMLRASALDLRPWTKHSVLPLLRRFLLRAITQHLHVLSTKLHLTALDSTPPKLRVGASAHGISQLAICPLAHQRSTHGFWHFSPSTWCKPCTGAMPDTLFLPHCDKIPKSGHSATATSL